MGEEMREIKFKIWDKKNKKWHIQYPSIGSFFNIYKDGTLSRNSEDDDYILVEYTGLKDKNGNEIYEGDIVRMRGLIAGHFEPMVGYVYYESPSFVVIATEPRGVRGKGRILSEGNLNEIIGNIYEDPELLEK